MRLNFHRNPFTIAFLTLSCLLISLPEPEAVDIQPVVGNSFTSEQVLDSSIRLEGMTWPRYLEELKPFATSKTIVTLREPVLSPEETEVQYGFNVIMPVEISENIQNLSWALITGKGKIPTLIVDANGNGVLSDDPRIEFSAKNDGSFYAQTEWKVQNSSEKTTNIALPVIWRIRQAGDNMRLEIYNCRENRGSIQIANENYLFVLRTDWPTFNAPEALVGIDLNRDGKIEFNEDDPEVFKVEDEFLSIAGREYRISVGWDGRKLSLTPTGRKAVDRPKLAAGSTAPMLPSGSPISWGHGRPLLLNFWSPGCGFSKRMAPQVRQAWGETNAVQFVSITNVPEDEASRASTGFGHDWPQIAGDEGGKLFKLYGITRIPTYFVIDKEGIIRARGNTMDWAMIRGVLEELSKKDSGGHKE